MKKYNFDTVMRYKHFVCVCVWGGGGGGEVNVKIANKISDRFYHQTQ